MMNLHYPQPTVNSTPVNLNLVSLNSPQLILIITYSTVASCQFIIRVQTPTLSVISLVVQSCHFVIHVLNMLVVNGINIFHLYLLSIITFTCRLLLASLFFFYDINYEEEGKYSAQSLRGLLNKSIVHCTITALHNLHIKRLLRKI